MFQPPYLTDAEIAKICEPLTNGAARYRFITRLGLHAERKPNGQPLVARSEFERVMGAARMAPQAQAGAGMVGDIAALRERWRAKNGPQAQRR